MSDFPKVTQHPHDVAWAASNSKLEATSLAPHWLREPTPRQQAASQLPGQHCPETLQTGHCFPGASPTPPAKAVRFQAGEAWAGSPGISGEPRRP